MVTICELCGVSTLKLQRVEMGTFSYVEKSSRDANQGPNSNKFSEYFRKIKPFLLLKYSNIYAPFTYKRPT